MALSPRLDNAAGNILRANGQDEEAPIVCVEWKRDYNAKEPLAKRVITRWYPNLLPQCIKRRSRADFYHDPLKQGCLAIGREIFGVS